MKAYAMRGNVKVHRLTGLQVDGGIEEYEGKVKSTGGTFIKQSDFVTHKYVINKVLQAIRGEEGVRRGPDGKDWPI